MKYIINLNYLLFLRQNFSIPDPIPESIIKASVLNAALQTPARAFPLYFLIKLLAKLIIYTLSKSLLL